MRVRFSGLELDDHRGEITRDGTPVAVEPRVFELLAYLVRHRGRIVGKDELLDRLWPGRDVQEGALSVCVHRARRLAGDACPPLIRTVARRGYRFVGPVETCELRPALPDVFVGREREIGELRRIVDALTTTSLRTVEVRGERGVGKSTLLEEIGTYGRRRRMEVLRAAPPPGAENEPYSIWAQMIGAYVARYDSRSIRRAMGPHLGSLASIVPFLRCWADPVPLQDSDAFHDSLAEAVAISMRAAAADRPVLLLFDDAERTDRQSLVLLGRLLSICAGSPVLIAIASSGISPSMEPVLETMRQRPGHRRFELGGLDGNATRALLEHLAGAPVGDALVAAAMRATAGMPGRIDGWWRAASSTADRGPSPNE